MAHVDDLYKNSCDTNTTSSIKKEELNAIVIAALDLLKNMSKEDLELLRQEYEKISAENKSRFKFTSPICDCCHCRKY